MQALAAADDISYQEATPVLHACCTCSHITTHYHLTQLLPASFTAPLFPAGLYQGTPVSIITTLMGMPNMDFVVREARAVVDGQMAIIRLGTCGALRPPAQLGSFMVASPGAVCVRYVERAVRC
jgi:nucleoside phosphorylase